MHVNAYVLMVIFQHSEKKFNFKVLPKTVNYIFLSKNFIQNSNSDYSNFCNLKTKKKLFHKKLENYVVKQSSNDQAENRELVAKIHRVKIFISVILFHW